MCAGAAGLASVFATRATAEQTAAFRQQRISVDVGSLRKTVAGRATCLWTALGTAGDLFSPQSMYHCVLLKQLSGFLCFGPMSRCSQASFWFARMSQLLLFYACEVCSSPFLWAVFVFLWFVFKPFLAVSCQFQAFLFLPCNFWKCYSNTPATSAYQF
jgi:hypothetical protein